MKNFVIARFNWLQDNWDTDSQTLRLFYRSFHDELLDNSLEPYIFVQTNSSRSVQENFVLYKNNKTANIIAVRDGGSPWLYSGSELLAQPDFFEQLFFIKQINEIDKQKWILNVKVTVEDIYDSEEDVLLYFNYSVDLDRFKIIPKEMSLSELAKQAATDWRIALREGDFEDFRATSSILFSRLSYKNLLPIVFMDINKRWEPLTSGTILDREVMRFVETLPYNHIWFVKAIEILESLNKLKCQLINPFSEAEQTAEISVPQHLVGLPLEILLERHFYLNS